MDTKLLIEAFSFQQLDEWRSEMRTKLEEIDENVNRDDNIRGHVEVLIKDNRISASKIQRLESDFVNIKLEMSKTVPPTSMSDELQPQNLSSIHQILQTQQEQIE